MNTAEFKVESLYPNVWAISVAGIDNCLYVFADNDGSVKFVTEVKT